MMNKVTDRRGNYMKYHYLEDNHTGTWRPDYIEYTGNAKANPDLMPYNKVKFYYGIRSDSTVAFVGGTQIKNNLLLRKIRTFAEGDFAHEYRFTYFKDEFASFLNEITETSFTGERLNSTVVGWGEKSADFDTNNYYIPKTLSENGKVYSSYLYYGDFDGDGKTDIFVDYFWYEGHNQNNKRIPYQWRIYKSTGNGFSLYKQVTETSTAYDFTYIVADINGDGKDDLYRISKVNSDDSELDLLINYGDGFTFYDLGIQDPYRINSFAANFRSGDFNGDGENDLVLFHREGNNDHKKLLVLTFPLIQPNGNSFVIGELDFIEDDSSADNISCYDFNGDGKTDILFQNDNDKLVVWEFNFEAPQAERFDTLYFGFPGKHTECFWGDFNGDGALDVLTYRDDQNLWKLNINTTNYTSSNCFNTTIVDVPVDRDFDPDDLAHNNYFTFDCTGDGLCDIVEIYNTTDNNYVLNLYCSTGNSFVEKTLPITTNLSCIWDVIRPTDFNGDMAADIKFNFDWVQANPNFKVISFSPENKSRFVKTISDGMDNRINIEYALGNNASCYTPGTYPVSLVMPFNGKLYLVPKVTFSNVQGIFKEQKYAYSGGAIHRRGKGFLGFSTISSRETFSSLEVIQYFDFDHNVFSAFPKKEISRQYQDMIYIDSTVYTNLIQHITSSQNGTTRFKSYLDKQSYYDVINNNQTFTEYITYDAYGNITEAKTTQASNGNIAGTQTTTTTYTGAVSNPSGCDYLPDFTTTTYARPGEASISNSTQYWWSADGKPWIEVAWRNTPKAVTTLYFDYNAFGTPLGISVSATGLDTRYSSATYDSKGRYPITKTDAMGWTLAMQYDHRTGQVTKATDINGLTTLYQYDGFGRTRLTEFPDGLTLQQSMQWDLNSTISNACYYTTSTLIGSPPQKVWYDRLGREILAQSIDFAGQPVNAKTLYDTKGRLWKTSEPYADGTTATQFTLFDYDALGRNYQTTLPTGVKHVTNYAALSQNQITTYASYGNDTWQTVTKTMNAFGEPVSITDQGGTIHYQYFSNGLPRSITANGSTITMTYDLHGNRDTLIDPDAGLITTFYNNFDELTTQTDARQNTYTMTYDKLGRMITRSGPYGELTSWDYENTQAGKLGQLNGVTMNNGTAQAYTYDVLGRLNTQTETTGSHEFTKTYSYDALGRLQNEYWHTGFGLNYQYNTWGYMSQVTTPANQPVWQAGSFNARGQATSYNLGSQYQVVREYDAWGFPKRIKTMKNGNPSEIENLYYTFDFKRGNLTQRGTLKYYRWDIFTYDALDRLNTETETISGNALATSYAGNGNILTRSDVGTYAYSQTNAGPHAVTGITNASGTLLPEHRQSVSYTPFNKVSHISQQNYDYFVTYGPDRLRRRTSLHTGIADGVLLTKYYAFGDYEKEVTPVATRHLHYIQGGDGLAAVYVKNEGGSDSLYLIMKDHLGSIIGAINQETGTVYLQNFDAWGRKRNPQTWAYTDIPTYFPLDRGFTGHEHLDKFDLINMNGRMYDASLCRFLSPDPYVQMPDYSQNFNRYSYALNNPLLYTDPSGEFFLSLICPPLVIVDMALWSAVIDAAFQGISIMTNNQQEFNFAELGGAFVGGALGGAAAFLAPTIGSGSGLLLKYIGKASYAGLSASASTTGGLLAQDFFDNGKIDFNGTRYWKTAATSFATAFGISALSSAYQYASWDRLDPQGKIDKLNKNGYDIKLGESGTTEIEGKAYPKYGYRRNGDIYMTKEGLSTYNYFETKSTYLHEGSHLTTSKTRQYQGMNVSYGSDVATYYSEVNAYKFELSNSRFLSANYRNYLRSNMVYYSTKLQQSGLNMSVPSTKGNSIFNFILNLY